MITFDHKSFFHYLTWRRRVRLWRGRQRPNPHVLTHIHSVFMTYSPPLPIWHEIYEVTMCAKRLDCFYATANPVTDVDIFISTFELWILLRITVLLNYVQLSFWSFFYITIINKEDLKYLIKSIIFVSKISFC